MADIKFENASVGQLKGEVFRLMPEPDDLSFDQQTVIHCATILLELRRRAVDKQDIKLLHDVKIFRDELRDVIQTIRQNASGQTTGILLPGMRDFHL